MNCISILVFTGICLISSVFVEQKGPWNLRTEYTWNGRRFVQTEKSYWGYNAEVGKTKKPSTPFGYEAFNYAFENGPYAEGRRGLDFRHTDDFAELPLEGGSHGSLPQESEKRERKVPRVKYYSNNDNLVLASEKREFSAYVRSVTSTEKPQHGEENPVPNRIPLSNGKKKRKKLNPPFSQRNGSFLERNSVLAGNFARSIKGIHKGFWNGPSTPSCSSLESKSYCLLKDLENIEFLDDLFENFAEEIKAYENIFKASDLIHPEPNLPPTNEGWLCPATATSDPVGIAKNSKGEWKWIVNSIKNATLQQKIYIEECQVAGESCSHLNFLAHSSCIQKIGGRHMLAWSEKQGIHLDVFILPKACACFIYKINYTFLKTYVDTLKENYL